MQPVNTTAAGCDVQKNDPVGSGLYASYSSTYYTGGHRLLGGYINMGYNRKKGVAIGSESDIYERCSSHHGIYPPPPPLRIYLFMLW